MNPELKNLVNIHKKWKIWVNKHVLADKIPILLVITNFFVAKNFLLKQLPSDHALYEKDGEKTVKILPTMGSVLEVCFEYPVSRDNFYIS